MFWVYQIWKRTDPFAVAVVFGGGWRRGRLDGDGRGGLNGNGERLAGRASVRSANQAKGG